MRCSKKRESLQQLDESANFCPNCGTAVNSLHYNKESSTRKTTYEGTLYKCPNCGEHIKSFVSICPSCGYEIRDSKSHSHIDKLAQKLENASTSEQRIELIRNYYIPNTKEDIYEFIILATSNIKTNDDIEAWYTKLEQAYQKATLSFKDTPDFQYIDKIYQKEKKRKSIYLLTKNLKKSANFRHFTLLILGILLLVIGSIGGAISRNPDSPIYMLGLIGLLVIVISFSISIVDKSN